MKTCFDRETGISNVTQCWSSYWAFTEYRDQWRTENAVTRTRTSRKTIYNTTPSLPFGNVSWTSYCDGFPRFQNDKDALKAFEPITLPTPITTEVVYTSIEYPTSYPFSAAPSCTLQNQQECADIWKLFITSISNSLESFRSTNVLTVSVAPSATSIVVNGKPTPLDVVSNGLPSLILHNETYRATRGVYSISGATNMVGDTTLTPGGSGVLFWSYGVMYPNRPVPNGQNCSPLTGKVDEMVCQKVPCRIRASSVELLYFPPPVTSRDLCANTRWDVDPSPQSIFSHPHRSAVINGSTFWSDKAYIRYDTISAYKYCSFENTPGQRSISIGGTYTNAYIEVSSSDVSTICGRLYMTSPGRGIVGRIPKPANFDDFNGPVPASAYQCMAYCHGQCETIIAERFVPHLAVPPQVRTLDPEWSSCEPYFEGVFNIFPYNCRSLLTKLKGVPDPPIALSSKDVFEPTPTISRVSVPATPGIAPIPWPPGPTTWPEDPGASPLPNYPLDFSDHGSHQNDPHRNDATHNPDNQSPHPDNNEQTPPSPCQTFNNQPLCLDPQNPSTAVLGNPQNTPSLQTLPVHNGIIVISGTTVHLDSPATKDLYSNKNPEAEASFTINGVPLKLLRDGRVVIGSDAQPHTIYPGDPETAVNGHRVFIDTGEKLVVDGKAFTLDWSTAPGRLVVDGADGSRSTVSLSFASAAGLGDDIAGLVRIIGAVGATRKGSDAGSESGAGVGMRSGGEGTATGGVSVGDTGFRWGSAVPIDSKKGLGSKMGGHWGCLGFEISMVGLLTYLI